MSGAILAAAAGRIPVLAASLKGGTFLFGTAAVPGTVQTISSVGVSVVGGTPPYTYTWTYVSGDTGIYPNSRTASATRFSRYFSSPVSETAIWMCAVTDALANTVTSNNATITLEGFS